MNVNYPKICVCKDKRVYVFFYINSKRYRLFNGKRIGIDIDPNSYPDNLRYDKAQLLAAEVYKYLTNGGVFKEYNKESLVTGKLRDIDYLKMALNRKSKENYSDKYISMLEYVLRGLLSHSKGGLINSKSVESYLNNFLVQLVITLLEGI